MFISICHTCEEDKDSVKWCGRCKTVKYCSRICQKKDWSEHKKICIRPHNSFRKETSDFFRNQTFITILCNLRAFWDDGKHNSLLVLAKPIVFEDMTKGIEKHYDCIITKHNMTQGYKKGLLNVELHLEVDSQKKEFLIVKNAIDNIIPGKRYNQAFCLADDPFDCTMINNPQDSKVSTCFYDLGDRLYA